jgi:drug/metabolite transporter (DMT)-like permease
LDGLQPGSVPDTLPRMRDELAGAGYIAVSAMQFGGVVVLGKISARDGLPVLGVLAIRFAIAALLLAIGVKLRRGSLRPAPTEAIPLAALGALGYAVEASFFFLAIARGTASAVTLLFFIYPAVVMVLSVMLRMSMPGALVIGSLVTSMAGAALVVTSSGGVDISAVGIAFAIASGATFAVYLIGAERTLKLTPPLTGATWTSGSAAAALAAFVLVTQSGRLPHGAQWAPVIGMGIGTAGAFATLFAGLRRLGAVRTSIIAALEPLTTAVLAIIFLSEPVRVGTVTGGALILAGSVAASLARAPRAEAVP